MLTRFFKYNLIGVRYFRLMKAHNPYEVKTELLTEKEREKEKVLPVWDRKFDHEKYLKQKGPLKV